MSKEEKITTDFVPDKEYEKYFDHHHKHGLTLVGDEQNHHHSHSHSPEHIKLVSNRLSKAIGHLESVKRMVQDDRDCKEVLMQLTAVRNALTNIGKVILKEHMEHCVTDAIREGDEDAVEDMKKVIDYFIK